MEYNTNAVNAGVGLMGSIGLGLGLLLFFLIDELNADNQEEVADTVGLVVGFASTVLAIMFCPIVASIVGAIISKDFDQEEDAAFNGAITGAVGTILMVFVVGFVLALSSPCFDTNRSKPCNATTLFYSTLNLVFFFA